MGAGGGDDEAEPVGIFGGLEIPKSIGCGDGGGGFPGIAMVVLGERMLGKREEGEECDENAHGTSLVEKRDRGVYCGAALPGRTLFGSKNPRLAATATSGWGGIFKSDFWRGLDLLGKLYLYWYRMTGNAVPRKIWAIVLVVVIECPIFGH